MLLYLQKLIAKLRIEIPARKKKPSDDDDGPLAEIQLGSASSLETPVALLPLVATPSQPSAARAVADKTAIDHSKEGLVNGLDAMRARIAAKQAALTPSTAKIIARKAAEAAKAPVYRMPDDGQKPARTSLPVEGKEPSDPPKQTGKAVVLSADLGVTTELNGLRQHLESMSEADLIASAAATREARAALANVDTVLGRYNRKCHDAALMVAAKIAASRGIVLSAAAVAPSAPSRDRGGLER